MARIRLRDSGSTLRTVTRIRVRDASNTLRTITRVRIRDASNTLRTVWGGGLPDVETVTVGQLVSEFFTETGYRAGDFGSIDNGIFAPKSATITQLLYINVGGGAVAFVINGDHANSGWTTMTIGSTAFTRASAAFNSGGGSTDWSWNPASNPFGAVSGNTTVTFT